MSEYNISVERIVEYLTCSNAHTIENLNECPDSDYLKGQNFVESDLLSFIKEDGKKVHKSKYVIYERLFLKD